MAKDVVAKAFLRNTKTGPWSSKPGVFPPVNTSAPVVSGTARVGNTLSCSTGSWDNEPTSYAYQWLRDGSPISGATSETYQLQVADEEEMISCAVTAINSAGSASQVSNEVGPVEAAEEPGDWQLAAGHYVPSVAAPEIVFPRTNADSDSWEPHRSWPAGYAWICPIKVLFGAWPFKFEIDSTSAGKGMVVGSTLTEGAGGVLEVSDEYAEIRWANPTIGSHSITVTVYTQEHGRNESGFDDELSVTFTLVVAAADDTSKFCWASGSGSDSNAGTPSSPYRTLGKVLSEAGHTGRQFHLLPGTYNTNASGNLALGWVSDTAPVMIGHPELGAVEVEMTQRSFYISRSGACAWNFTVTDDGYGATVSNSRIFTVNAGHHRWSLYRVNSQNPSNGTVGDDNPSTVMATGGGSARNQWFISRCNETGRPNSSNAAALYVLYACSRGVAEFNSVSGSARYAMLLKDSNTLCTVRANTATGSSEIALSTGCQRQSYTTEKIETCYNKTTRDIRWNYQASSQYGEQWIYRNASSAALDSWNESQSGQGPINVFQNAFEGGVKSGSRVIQSDTQCDNVDSLDNDLNLKGAYRTNWLGTRAAEIA